MTVGTTPGATSIPVRRLALERFVPYRLNVLANMVSNALARIYAERFQLTIPQWRVIATLGEFEIRTARDIANHSVMHKSTVSRAVAALEARSLIERRPNPQDMREELLVLSCDGRAIYDAVVPEALAFADSVMSTLGPAEREAFYSLIDRLDAHVRALAPDQEPMP